MAASILSQDILAICLILANGNIDLHLEEIILRLENYQETQNRYFGISRADFRNLFHMLFGWHLGSRSLTDEFGDIKLSDTIPYILKYNYTHFNEEGEYWGNHYNNWNKEIEYWFGYDAKKYQDKMRMKKDMNRFFEKESNTPPNEKLVKAFMEELQITESILWYCSRSCETS